MKKIGLFAVVAALVWAVPAYAQAPPLDTYGGAGEVLGDVQQGAPTSGGDQGGVLGDTEQRGETPADGGGVAGDTAEGAPGSTPSSSGSGPAAGVTAPRGGAASQGTLPFTGLDLALMLAGGALLLGVGLSVRRLSRPVA